jgi:hypothetical protein
MKGTALVLGRTWTADEVSYLREHYTKDGGEACGRAIGRTAKAVWVKAHALGICVEKWWTGADDERLRKLWGEISLRQIAETFGRAQTAIHQRAQKLGLGVGAPPGFEHITAAAKRTGFEVPTLRGILAWAADAGVTDKRRPVERLPYSPRSPRAKQWRRHIVDSFDVDEAVAAWMETETMEEAGRARGVSPETVRLTLRRFGDGVSSNPGKKKHWRVQSRLIDDAFKRKAATETLGQVAARVGISRDALARKLRPLGIPGTELRPWRVRPGDVDAALGRSA